MNFDVKHYEPPGPIGWAFIKSRGPINAIMGPGGSGKTVASCVKGVMHAAEFMPVCKDGWVRVKTLCVRDTYRSFARTALASWYNMFPEKHAWTVKHEGGQDRPVVHTLQWEAIRGRDKIKIEYVMETGAIGDNDLETFAKGYEISMAWGNEYDLLPENTLPIFFQRCGRYPPMEMIAPSEIERVSREGRKAMQVMGLEVDDSEPVLPRIVWGDMNPPDSLEHPAYTTPFGETSKPGAMVENITPGWHGFWQPGGLSPNAENRKGKPRSSYELEAATTKDKRLVQRMVHSLPANSAAGAPVYPEFSRVLHLADQPIEPTPGLGLTIGVDAGGSPAATIGQPQPNGQERLLAELVTDPGTGPTRFGNMLIDLLIRRFPNLPILGVWGDPAAFMGGDTQTGEFNWIQVVQGIIRTTIQVAPSNEPHIRQEAVRFHLTNLIDGQTPGYLVDPRCKVMVGGFEAHYMLTKQATAGATDNLAVVKNKHSHPHDAEQYRILGYRGLAAVIGEAAKASLPGNVTSLQQRRQERNARQQQYRQGDFNVWDV
ncbi:MULTISPECIES: hypothetical protein [unclassified Rhizobium]|uniref:hypothetical protein n=1 Tax=unclassified Rhizobium TaxID=2613769 RepID=UPI00161E063B|nr:MULTISPECIES: hypothetical protein [unclassified Rhizobium]MBB3385995.1 hypothetical protein [Rhizobium sp. BK098]MBB3617828.1 hypothetical protein [Rhizobium sp. BK609]MBB3683357.1 hypothetical protein [Rhizobium sp. BK612]